MLSLPIRKLFPLSDLRMEVVQSLPSLLDMRRLRIASHRAVRLVFRSGDSSPGAWAVQDRHCLLLSDYVMGQGGREAKILGLV